MLESGYFDSDLYDGNGVKNKYDGYVTSIGPNDDVDEEEDDGVMLNQNNRRTAYTAPAAIMKEVQQVSGSS